MIRTTNPLLQPAFLICLAVLAMAALGMDAAIEKSGAILEKEPVALRKSLEQIDKSALLPFKVVNESSIDNKDILKSLGTEDYIQWIMEDPTVPDDSAVQRFLLFITYYGLPDRVPHVPEECYTGGGYQRLATDRVTFEVGKTDISKTIRGKYLVFGRVNSSYWNMSTKFPVLYFFRVNEDYAGSRDEARIALNKNLFNKSSYFSKVELAFNQSIVPPNKEEAIAASEKLLSVILPILENEFWPDLEE